MAKSGDLLKKGDNLKIATKNAIYSRNCKKFIEEVCKVKDETGAVLDFKLWGWQLEYIEMLLNEDDRYICVLKSRGIGFSEVTAAYIYWKTKYTGNVEVKMLSKTENHAIDLLEKIKFFNDNAGKFKLKPRTVNATTIKWSNGSRITSLTSSPDAARGGTNYMIFWDETAFAKEDEDTWKALKPSLRQKGRCIVGSTPKGMGNIFHYMYEQDDQFNKRQWDWTVHPLRSEEWALEEGKDHPEDKSKARLFAQEYGCSFIGSSQAVFDRDVVDSMLHRLREINPRTLRRYGTPLRIMDGVKIWEEYDRKEKYAIGVDVSDEQLKGDYSVIAVVSKTTNKVVALFHGYSDWGRLSRVIVSLSSMYGGALVGVEENNHGHAVLVHLKRTAVKLYYRKSFDARTDKWTSTIGWLSNKKTKPILIGELQDMVNQYSITIYDEKALKEFVTFAYVESGSREKAEAMKGFHDDCVMAIGIAFQVLKDVRMPKHEQHVDDNGEKWDFYKKTNTKKTFSNRSRRGGRLR